MKRNAICMVVLMIPMIAALTRSGTSACRTLRQTEAMALFGGTPLDGGLKTNYPFAECATSQFCVAPDPPIPGCSTRSLAQCTNFTETQMTAGNRQCCHTPAPAPGTDCEEGAYYVCKTVIRCAVDPLVMQCRPNGATVSTENLPTCCDNIDP